MNRFDRFRLWLARGAIKAAGVTFLPEWVRYGVLDPTWRNLLKEGYKANSAAFACMNVVVPAFGTPPLRAWRETALGKEPVMNTPVRSLMRRPNADMGEVEFHKLYATYLHISGNAYIWKQRSRGKKPVALWPFHDGQMIPIPGRGTAEGWVAYFVLKTEDGTRKSFLSFPRWDDLSGVAIPKEDVIHLKYMPDPEHPWMGMGAIAAAAVDVDTDSEVSSYVFSLLKNDATPRVVVTLMEGEMLTEDKSKRLTAEWRQKYSNRNRGVPAFLEAGMTVTRVGHDLNELAFEALRNVPESRIAASFGRGVAYLAGLNVGLQRSTFTNYPEARRAFTEDSLVPLWRYVASEFDASLRVDFPGEYELAYDLSDIPALRQNETELWGRARGGWNDGLTTRAESRRIIGLPVGPADNVYKLRLVDDFQPAKVSEPPKQLQIKAQAGNYTGVMVAFFIPDPDLIASDFPAGAEVASVDQLHLTLVYLGTTDEVNFTQSQLVAAVEVFASRYDFLEGRVNGVGRFTNTHRVGKDAIFAIFNAQGLAAMRLGLVDSLVAAGIKSSGGHGFVPHITLAYIDKESPMPAIDLPDTNYKLDTVTVAWGGNYEHVPLTGFKRLGRVRGGGTKSDSQARRRLVTVKREALERQVKRLAPQIDEFFSSLADTVVARARRAEQGKGRGSVSVKELEGADLLSDDDFEPLAQLTQQAIVQLLGEIWPLLDIELDSEAQFDENDPRVAEALANAGASIGDISETTQAAIVDLLQYASENGWSIDRIVNGDGDRPGLRDLVAQTYSGRDEAIARTELGKAQNTATAGRYRDAGVRHVQVFDNGFDNSHPFCRRVDRKIVTIEWMERNPLQHPNCVRAFGAVFNYQGEVFSEEERWI